MKNKGLTIFLICLFSIFIILLIVFMTLVLRNDSKIMNFNFIDRVSDNIIFDETYEELPSKIDIDVNAADIFIENSNDNNVHVKIYSDKDKLKNHDVNMNKDLNIKLENRECRFFCINIVKSKIIVSLPSTYDKEIVLNNNYGDIEIDSFENLNLNANLDAGDINIKKINTAFINNNYGDVDIDIINKADIKESCGDVSINKVKDITVENNFGDIKIESITEYMNLENNCGDIKIDDAKIIKNSNIKSDLGDITIDNMLGVYVDAKTDLGDINIKNNNHKSDIVLTIKNNCGDINVND